MSASLRQVRISASVAPSKTGVMTLKPRFAAAQPGCVSRIWPTVMGAGRRLVDQDAVVLLGAERLVGDVVAQLLLVEHVREFLHHRPELIGDLLVVDRLQLLLLLVELLLLVVAEAGLAAEALRVDDHPL